MNNRITPALLAALDLASDQPPTNATLEYLKHHQAPDLATEIAKVQSQLRDTTAEGYQERTKRRRWIYNRRVSFRLAKGDPDREQGLVIKYYQAGASLDELVQITEESLYYVKKNLGDLLDDD